MFIEMYILRYPETWVLHFSYFFILGYILGYIIPISFPRDVSTFFENRVDTLVEEMYIYMQRNLVFEKKLIFR